LKKSNDPAIVALRVATLVLRWLGNDTELLFFLDGD